MHSSLPELARGKTISSVNLYYKYDGDAERLLRDFGRVATGSPNTIDLGINESKFLRLSATADCCSVSWFELGEQPLESIIDKTISTIDIDSHIEMSPSEKQEYDSNLPVTITFKDDSRYILLLRNSSNGYYCGWLNMELVTN